MNARETVPTPGSVAAPPQPPPPQPPPPPAEASLPPTPAPPTPVFNVTPVMTSTPAAPAIEQPSSAKTVKPSRAAVPVVANKMTKASEAQKSAPAPVPAPEPALPADTVPAVANKTTKASAAAVAVPKPAAPAAPAAKREPTKPVPPTLMTATVARPDKGSKATTDERQIAAALEKLKRDKEAREKAAAQLPKAFADGGPPMPVRSGKQLTMPEPFKLHASNKSLEVVVDAEQKPMMEKVKEFTKTPQRFRSKPADATPEVPTPASLTQTVPVAPTLMSELRAASKPKPKSSAEIEEELLKSIPAFKARPVDRRVLESAGDLGVKRVEPRKTTEFAVFNLATTNLPSSQRRRSATKDDDERSDAGSTQSAPAYPGFKAKPVNKKLLAGKAAGLAIVTPRKITKPISPKLNTSLRAREAPAAVEPTFEAFKARPMPDHSKASPAKQVATRPVTMPKPFELESVARHEMAEQTQKHRHEEQAKAEAAARVFKARKMLVVPEAWKPTVESKHTAPAPFSLTTDARHEVASSAFEAKRQEEERQAAKDREFKATKPTVLSVPPFEPHKSTKPLTSLSAAKFQRTENRFERRKEFEAQLAARRAQKEAEVAVTAQQKAVEEAAALVELKKALVHKARPVMKGAPFVVTKQLTRPLTKPKEPALQTRDRAAARPAVPATTPAVPTAGF